jgi:chromosomal replication initiator protein
MSFVPTATAVLNYWVRILAALEKKINRQSYETWLKPTRFSHLEGKKLFVRIPSSDFQHIGDRYADLIQEAIDNLGLDVETVAFTTPEQDPRTPKVREDGGFAPVSSHSQNAPRQGRMGTPMGGSNSGPAPEQARFDWSAASQHTTRSFFTVASAWARLI